MYAECTQCGRRLRPHANYCGQCGSEVTYPMQTVDHGSALAVMPPPMPVLPLTAGDAELAARMQLEAVTRLHPRMNRERNKTALMRRAARRDSGTVGYWCDD